VNESGGLRERKKIATREAISAAAYRLALAHGPDNVRVDDIADAAGISPRTYHNYFASREQAIVAAVVAERTLRIRAALRARPADEPLADAVVAAVVEQYQAPNRDALVLITSAQGLREEFVDAVGTIEQPLAAAIIERTGDTDELRAAVLAAAVSAAVRVAVRQWVQPVGKLVVPQGSLAERLHAALAYVAPALAAAEHP
jgi:AcrR family transcriptional regulator